jgi:hypothetical protein
LYFDQPLRACNGKCENSSRGVVGDNSKPLARVGGCDVDVVVVALLLLLKAF